MEGKAASRQRSAMEVASWLRDSHGSHLHPVPVVEGPSGKRAHTPIDQKMFVGTIPAVFRSCVFTRQRCTQIGVQQREVDVAREFACNGFSHGLV